VLTDWFGWPLVGADADAVLANLRNILGDDEVPFLTFIAARSRIAEDWLVASGAKQYVILGAGLDSFAWRQSGTVDVFEVDDPSTQAWKRARIAALGLPTPAQLTWVPVDFEVQSLGASLAATALDARRGVFVSWLGVTPYLTAEAIATTLRALPACSLAVGYVPCEAERDADARQHGATLEARVRELGEPWIMLPTREEFAGLLAANGFEILQDVGAHDLESRYEVPMVNYERMALARKSSSA
jgi:methyltransferase (TIGR00027 family)